MRELRKVEHSKKVESDEEDVRSPKLWYYNEMLFLKNDINITPLREENEPQMGLNQVEFCRILL